jgi:hypothetical protein
LEATTSRSARDRTHRPHESTLRDSFRVTRPTWTIRSGGIASSSRSIAARHALAKKIRFVDDGVFRSGDLDEIMSKVSALSVLSNAVLVWNTERITEIARRALRRRQGSRRARLLVSGRYNFEKLTAPE